MDAESAGPVAGKRALTVCAYICGDTGTASRYILREGPGLFSECKRLGPVNYGGSVLSVGSLFSGIGGLELGLERAGMQVRWQVEIDDYANKVLARHWPDVPRYRDVRECHGELADAERQRFLVCGHEQGDDIGISGKGEPGGAGTIGGRSTDTGYYLPHVDLICGGFPCQDVSLAGARAGLDGKRSTLWSEFARLIREIRPRWVLAENVPGLLSSDDGRFFGNILRDLAAAGYDAEWGVLSAADMGAPHLRKRVFIVAHTRSDGRRGRRDGDAGGSDGALQTARPGAGEEQGLLAHRNIGTAPERGQRADAPGEGLDWRDYRGGRCGDVGQESDGSAGKGADVPHANGRIEGWGKQPERVADRRDADIAGHGAEGELADATEFPQREQTDATDAITGSGGTWPIASGGSGWAVEPDVGRVADGIPARVDRLRCLGNAVVPQCAEWIGRRILDMEGR